MPTGMPIGFEWAAVQDDRGVAKSSTARRRQRVVGDELWRVDERHIDSSIGQLARPQPERRIAKWPAANVADPEVLVEARGWRLARRVKRRRRESGVKLELDDK